RTYTNLLADQTNQDFVGTINNFTISGNIKSTLQGGSPLGGVSVALSGAATHTTTTDDNGNYSFVRLSAGNYTVTPTKQEFTMMPPSTSLSISVANGAANFTAQSPLTGRMVF